MAFDTVGGTALNRTLTRAELIGRIVMKYQELPHTTRMKAIDNVEGLSVRRLKRINVVGTVLEPAALALAEAGIETGEVIGGIMRALTIPQSSMHRLCCSCRGETVTPEVAEDRWQDLARKLAHRRS